MNDNRNYKSFIIALLCFFMISTINAMVKASALNQNYKKFNDDNKISSGQANKMNLLNSKKNLDKVISDYIFTKYSDRYFKGEKAIAAYKILKMEVKGNIITVYLQTRFGWFSFENGFFTPVSGCTGIPSKIKLARTQAVGYKVMDYQEATEGPMWAKSVWQMFPRVIASGAIRYNDRNKDELWKTQQQRARDYLKTIGRADADISLKVKKNRGSSSMSKAISLVTSEKHDFPDWNGRREILFSSGGPSPNSKIRCVLETRAQLLKKNSYFVTLTKTWQITVNGQKPISCWKYEVEDNRKRLVEAIDNDGIINTIK